MCTRKSRNGYYQKFKSLRPQKTQSDPFKSKPSKTQANTVLITVTQGTAINKTQTTTTSATENSQSQNQILPDTYQNHKVTQQQPQQQQIMINNYNKTQYYYNSGNSNEFIQEPYSDYLSDDIPGVNCRKAKSGPSKGPSGAADRYSQSNSNHNDCPAVRQRIISASRNFKKNFVQDEKNFGYYVAPILQEWVFKKKRDYKKSMNSKSKDSNIGDKMSMQKSTSQAPWRGSAILLTGMLRDGFQQSRRQDGIRQLIATLPRPLRIFGLLEATGHGFSFRGDLSRKRVFTPNELWQYVEGMDPGIVWNKSRRRRRRRLQQQSQDLNQNYSRLNLQQRQSQQKSPNNSTVTTLKTPQQHQPQSQSSKISGRTPYTHKTLSEYRSWATQVATRSGVTKPTVGKWTRGVTHNAKTDTSEDDPEFQAKQPQHLRRTDKDFYPDKYVRNSYLEYKHGSIRVYQKKVDSQNRTGQTGLHDKDLRHHGHIQHPNYWENDDRFTDIGREYNTQYYSNSKNDMNQNPSDNSLLSLPDSTFSFELLEFTPQDDSLWMEHQYKQVWKCPRQDYGGHATSLQYFKVDVGMQLVKRFEEYRIGRVLGNSMGKSQKDHQDNLNPDHNSDDLPSHRLSQWHNWKRFAVVIRIRPDTTIHATIYGGHPQTHPAQSHQQSQTSQNLPTGHKFHDFLLRSSLGNDEYATSAGFCGSIGGGGGDVVMGAGRVEAEGFRFIWKTMKSCHLGMRSRGWRERMNQDQDDEFDNMEAGHGAGYNGNGNYNITFNQKNQILVQQSQSRMGIGIPSSQSQTVSKYRYTRDFRSISQNPPSEFASVVDRAKWIQKLSNPVSVSNSVSNSSTSKEVTPMASSNDSHPSSDSSHHNNPHLKNLPICPSNINEIHALESESLSDNPNSPPALPQDALVDHCNDWYTLESMCLLDTGIGSEACGHGINLVNNRLGLQKHSCPISGTIF